MKPTMLPVQRLSREAFAPFGEVIATDGAASFPVNDGRAQRFHDLAAIDALQNGGRAVMSIFRTDPVALPLAVRVLERHILGSQAFVPLHGEPFLVVVAPTGPDGWPEAPQAFSTDGRQGVSFRRGTWHHPLLALHGRCDFLVVDREGSGEDCETAELQGDYMIAASAIGL